MITEILELFVYVFMELFQLAAFRNIQSTDGKNLTHNFRPVQPLDGRIIYRNNIDESETPTVTNTPKTTGKAPDSTTPLTTPSTKSTPEPKKTEPENKNATQNSGQEAMWSTARLYLFYFILLLSLFSIGIHLTCLFLFIKVLKFTFQIYIFIHFRFRIRNGTWNILCPAIPLILEILVNYLNSM